MSASTRSSRTEYTASAPAVSLPKGGGAIQGIGEKFSVNPVTGTGSLSVPIAVSPGRGFAPELAVSYDSGAGNGIFGMGWDIGVPSISRKTQKGLPRYLDGEDSDVFLLSGAEDLVPAFNEDPADSEQWERDKILKVSPEDRIDTTVLTQQTQRDAFLSSFPDGGSGTYTIRRYRPRTEGLFARIERWQHQETGDIHWRVTTPDNVTNVYGKDENSRIFDPADSLPIPSRIFEWLLCESYDDKGHVISYRYKAEDGQQVKRSAPQERNRYTEQGQAAYSNRYLKRVLYGNQAPYQRSNKPEDWLFQVVFDYGEHDATLPKPDDVNSWEYRPDSFSSYRSGFEIRTQRLCQRVLMFHRFDHTGKIDKSGDGSLPWYLVSSTNFEYDKNLVATYLEKVIQTGYRWNGNTYDSKSYPPVEFTYDKPKLHHEIQGVDPDSLENLPVGLDNAAYQFLDLDGEGISGILTQQGGGWFYKANRGNGAFSPLQSVAKQPVGVGQQRFLDLAGDGQLDLVLLNRESPGFYERSLDEDWQNFQAFRQLPNVDWNDPNLRLIDLNGDGHADILLSEEQVFVWHPSMAEEGFGPSTRVEKSWDEETGPALVFADASQSVYLSDMSGDGLNDIVRIRNGAVCYWPNLGYGRFGAKVTMDAPPYFDHPELFEQRRIRLADIDGSGTTDIVYLGREGVKLWFNQAGNSWSEGQTLEQFPQVDNLASVQVVDLLGQGTACLVWSSPLPGMASQRMQYVDLMGGRKPHLLTGTKNNLGAETRLHYAPSTQFYLADKQAGKPWITKIPFPVHVLEKTETFAHISGNRFASSYAYHHGYFDGVEREFRGFGYVEQWDTEEYETFEAEGKKVFKVRATNDQGEVSHMPPIYTRTWFHTGAYLDRQHISTLFEDEYYRDDPNAVLLEDTVLQTGLTLQEEREACRALRGQMLRQEVYAQDGTDQAEHPYTVTEANYTIRVVQPMRDERHGVFFTHARESLAYHYERNPADPRIAHQIALEVDEFGNTLKALAVAYPRRQAQLPQENNKRSSKIKQQQEKILATLTETKVINKPDEDTWYRLGLPEETLTYEVTGLALSDLEKLNDESELRKLRDRLGQLPSLNYEQKPDGSLQKRLIEHMRMHYRPNATAGVLEKLESEQVRLGQVESLALPYESYELAFTPGLLGKIYGSKLAPADYQRLLGDEGRYVKDEQGQWWVPSGRQALDADNFYLPIQSQDPFGQITTTVYDDYHLLVTGSEDPIGNKVQANHDYWTLQPQLVTDPNGNRQEVVFDALGMVVATAVMGKELETENLGDSLAGVKPHLTDKDLADFLDDPLGQAKSLLGDATTRILYDLDRYHPNLAQKQPVYAVTLARETHVSDGEPEGGLKIQVSIEYSDGFGREIQTKVQAEKGPVPKLDANGKIQRDAQGKEITEEANPRWVGTGRIVYNNKGKPVKQYEPFFSKTHGYETETGLVEYGVSPTLHYDPLGRVIKTEMPNDTFSKVEFDAWEQTTWDENDTVQQSQWYKDRGRPSSEKTLAELQAEAQESEAVNQPVNQETRAAWLAAKHANTCSTAYLDTLGRPFLTLAHNGFKADDTPIEYETWVELDIEGNPLVITDDRGNRVMEYAYEIRAGEEDDEDGEEGEEEAYRIYLKSMDAGERWTLYNVAGNPIREWDSRGFEVRQAYDVLQRPTHLIVKDSDGKEILAERLVYGEGHREVDRLNLRGHVYQQYDGAGVVTNEQFDFKGNLEQSSRRLATEYKARVDWSRIELPTDLSQQEGKLTADEIAGMETAAETLLEQEEPFTTRSRFDALNRPIEIITPDKSVTMPGYNEANLLERMQVRVKGANKTTVFIKNINYDAKGQREKIEYGNEGVTTTYDYDEKTFRLTNLKTVRPSDSKTLQDLTYTYDPVGNITHIKDAAQQDVFFNNARVTAESSYEYDSLYRLIKATGREHLGQNLPAPQPTSDTDIPRTGLLHPGDGLALGRYEKEYVYDPVGNILEMIHRGTDPEQPGWRRCYQYAVDSNRLLSTGYAGDQGFPTKPEEHRYGDTPVFSQQYRHDAHGNMTKMPHLEDMPDRDAMQWDFEDQLSATIRQRVKDSNGTPGTTYYTYDAAGQRVRKVTEGFAAAGKEPPRLKERIYLGGVEIYRDYGVDGKTTALERETLHVMDDEQRIAVVETKTIEEKNGIGQEIRNSTSVFRYQLGNHLGSASVDLDDQGKVISYEEYYPYGSTAYQAGRNAAEVGLKQYRYTGKERDEKSGFYYNGVRYYISWLGRWSSCDPEGLTDSSNLFTYTNNNPLIYTDPNGSSIKLKIPQISEQHRHPPTSKQRDQLAPIVQEDIYALFGLKTNYDPKAGEISLKVNNLEKAVKIAYGKLSLSRLKSKKNKAIVKQMVSNFVESLLPKTNKKNREISILLDNWSADRAESNPIRNNKQNWKKAELKIDPRDYLYGSSTFIPSKHKVVPRKEGNLLKSIVISPIKSANQETERNHILPLGPIGKIVESRRKNRTYGITLGIIHEVQHNVYGMKDNAERVINGVSGIGEVVSKVNLLRRALSLPERASYSGKGVGRFLVNIGKKPFIFQATKTKFKGGYIYSLDVF
ncbi:MAG: SpvB/TcaC N-terminal domain-containing protein [Cyanobacteria bacterium P01_D01_bin.44]